jgi:hypothetical protein
LIIESLIPFYSSLTSGVNLIAKIDRFYNLDTLTLYRLESIIILRNLPSIVPLFLLGKVFNGID